ncbi:hypothetical protein DSO57_1038448 [Entomophthora muscae]|uniref:Uncharacterized protein n=1 Tax=Entomophthora muscae TaxID=34485 RepID=A0ACC2S120_9FUNG|nr:hypothetical protein DSO57_1038448 [Entomophthora muscae]
MGEKGIVADLDLPIQSRRGPEKIDHMLWKAIMTSLDKRSSCNTENSLNSLVQPNTDSL